MLLKDIIVKPDLEKHKVFGTVPLILFAQRGILLVQLLKVLLGIGDALLHLVVAVGDVEISRDGNDRQQYDNNAHQNGQYDFFILKSVKGQTDNHRQEHHHGYPQELEQDVVHSGLVVLLLAREDLKEQLVNLPHHSNVLAIDKNVPHVGVIVT